MKKPHCISLHYSARPYLNMLIMMMNIMLMRIKRIMIPVTMAENDGDRPYLNSTRLKSEHGGHIAAVVNFDADHTSTGCFFTLGLPLKVQSTKKLI